MTGTAGALLHQKKWNCAVQEYPSCGRDRGYGIHHTESIIYSTEEVAIRCNGYVAIALDRLDIA